MLEEGPRGSRTVASWAIPVGVVLLAAGLRLVGLAARPLWLDELVSLHVASSAWLDIACGQVFDNHTPPAYYLLLRGWLQVVPASIWWARMLSVVADAVTAGLVVVVFRRHLAPFAGVVAGVAYAASPFAIRLAQEARMYPLLALLAVAWFGGAAEQIRAPEKVWPAGVAAVAAVFGLYTHYYFALVLLCSHPAMMWLLRGSRDARRRWWVAMMVTGIAFVPWIPKVGALLSGGGQSFRSFGVSVVGYTWFRFVAGYALLPVHLDLKRDPWGTMLDHLPLLTWAAVSFAAVLAVAAWRAWTATPPARLVGVLAFGPSLVAGAVHTALPSLSDRYLVVSFPFVCGVLAMAGWRVWRPPAWVLPRVALVALMGTALLAHLGDPAAGTLRWRAAATVLRARVAAGEDIAVAPGFYAPLLRHHLGLSRQVTAWAELAGDGGREPTSRSLWVVEVVFLEKVREHLVGQGWRLDEEILLTPGNGLRISRLSRPTPAGGARPRDRGGREPPGWTPG